MTTWRVELGDCLDRLRDLPDASIDAIVTDPPYGLGFMGHDWDQPGKFAALRGNGRPAEFASGRAAEGPHVAGGQAALERQMARSSRRATQRDPATGAGHDYERAAAKPFNGHGPREGVRFGGPTGRDNTTHAQRGGGNARWAIRPIAHCKPTLPGLV